MNNSMFKFLLLGSMILNIPGPKIQQLTEATVQKGRSTSPDQKYIHVITLSHLEDLAWNQSSSTVTIDRLIGAHDFLRSPASPTYKPEDIWEIDTIVEKLYNLLPPGKKIFAWDIGEVLFCSKEPVYTRVPITNLIEENFDFFIEALIARLKTDQQLTEDQENILDRLRVNKADFKSRFYNAALLVSGFTTVDDRLNEVIKRLSAKTDVQVILLTTIHPDFVTFAEGYLDSKMPSAKLIRGFHKGYSLDQYISGLAEKPKGVCCIDDCVNKLNSLSNGILRSSPDTEIVSIQYTKGISMSSTEKLKGRDLNPRYSLTEEDINSFTAVESLLNNQSVVNFFCDTILKMIETPAQTIVQDFN